MTLSTLLDFPTTIRDFQTNLRLRARAARKSRAVTQYRLALIMNTHPNLISYYENGHTPLTLNKLLRIAIALDYQLEISFNDETPLPWPPPTTCLKK